MAEESEHHRQLILQAIASGYCMGCKWWRGSNDAEWAECRRRAPAAPPEMHKRKLSRSAEEAMEARVNYARWPVTYLRDWCGDYEDKRR